MTPNPQSPSAQSTWQGVLDTVVPAIVALQVTAVRSFQDDHAGAHGGTGFVVDAQQGLLLTNRHVCTCGPERASATFVGCPAMEEVPVSIAYVDPVHDFAILRFDPDQLLQTPRAEIALEPSGLHVGEEIRVVGNDSMEKLQIFSGTIARVDRDPPETGCDYHDENTFYALAGSGTRGGSSGSPVVNRRGCAVALNAASTGGTMHAFYLPLHRVARAVRAIQQGQAVPRGTLCAALGYTSFPECIRLGVTSEFVKTLLAQPREGGTFSQATPPGGMLQVKRCLPGSEAARTLRPGDVLLELKGEPCADFVHFDEAVDASVGGSVRVAICRGGERLEVELQVRDMHSLIPRSFLELGLGVFHTVPYHTAMKHHVPLEGIYVALSGIVFGEVVKSDAVILELDGVPCSDLASFEEQIRRLPNKEYFTVTWMVPKEVKERKRCTASVKMQRHWWAFRAWELDASSRRWNPRRLEPLLATGSCSAETSAASSEGSEGDSAEVPEAVPEPPAKRARKGRARAASAPLLERTLCSVAFRTVQNFDLDLNIDSENAESDVISIHGAGVVLNAEEGLVLTDRATVPQALGDVEVILGDVCYCASVWFAHPTHSLVILRVEGLDGAPTGVRRLGEPAAFEDHDFEPGDELEFVGVDVRGLRVTSQVRVQSVRLGNFPANYPPRWHESNLEAVLLENCPESSTSGFLCSKQGKVLALYSTTTKKTEDQVSRMGYGVPARVALPLLQQLQGELPPPADLWVPSLEVSFKSMELQKLRRLPARSRPSAAWMSRFASAGRALQVSGVTSKGPCDSILSEGDLFVAADGEAVTTMQDLEAKLWEAAQASTKSASEQGQKEPNVQVQLTVLRSGKELKMKVPLALLGCDCAKRVVCWNGMLLQETPRCVREFGQIPAGVHIVQTMLGSPGEANGIEGEFILSVDGRPTPSVDAILDVEQYVGSGGCVGAGQKSRRFLRVETADMAGRRYMKTLEPDPLFWPTSHMLQGPDGTWSCMENARTSASIDAAGCSK